MSEVIFDGSLASLYEYAYNSGAIGAHAPWAEPFFKAVNIAGGSGFTAAPGAFNPVYGAVVYDQINRETNAHAAIKKVGWTRAGIRITTATGSGAYANGFGGYDPGALVPTGQSTVDSIPIELDTVPTLLWTPIEATQGILARAKHDDGLNLWDWLAALGRDRHQQLINKELLRSPVVESAAINASNTDPKAAGNGKGLESIRRFLTNAAEATGKATGGNTNNFDVYQGQIDRTSASADYFESVVLRPDATDTGFGITSNLPFQLTGVNALIDQTEGNGGSVGNRIFLTGRDMHRAINDEVSTSGRTQLEVVEAKLDYNGLSPSALLAGRDVSYVLRSYQQTPIVVDRMVPSNGTTAGNGGVGTFAYQDGGTGTSDLMLLDQRDVEIRVMYPTLWATADNPAYLGRHSSVGTYATFEQLLFERTNRSGCVTSVA